MIKLFLKKFGVVWFNSNSPVSERVFDQTFFEKVWYCLVTQIVQFLREFLIKHFLKSLVLSGLTQIVQFLREFLIKHFLKKFGVVW